MSSKPNKSKPKTIVVIDDPLLCNTMSLKDFINKPESQPTLSDKTRNLFEEELVGPIESAPLTNEEIEQIFIWIKRELYMLEGVGFGVPERAGKKILTICQNITRLVKKLDEGF